jgi:Sulfotransferase family
MSRPKELNYFIAGVPWGNWGKGVDWYAGHFDPGVPVRGESSPTYTALSVCEGTAERMHSLVPDAKLIYLVRDPVERAISHYLNGRAAGNEQRSIDEALGDMGSHYVQGSLYYAGLKPYLKRYPLSAILILAQHDLLRRREETLRRIFTFLAVDESFRSPKFAREWQVSRGKDQKYSLLRRFGRKFGSRVWSRLPGGMRWTGERLAYYRVGGGKPRPKIDEALRGRLVEHFRGDAERLRELTGREFDEWSV